MGSLIEHHEVRTYMSVDGNIERDFRRIPPGESCQGCPYWVELSARTIPGGVPFTRCLYLGVDGDPLINDGIKVCDVDLPADMYIGPPPSEH